MTFPIQRMTLAVLATLSISACAHEHGAHDHEHGAAAAEGTQRATEAVARLQPTVGSPTQGTIRFVHEGDQIRIQGEVAGLEPNSDHGFHVHEKGDCSAPDATSAGGHFHLPGQKHGDPARDDDHHHAGDLGNIHAGADGVAKVDLVLPQKQLTLGDGPQNILGRGLIVHKGKDDLHSQPTGDAGGRAACAVIKAVR